MSTEHTADDIPSRHHPAASDPQLYKAWEDAGVFGAAATASSRVGGSQDPFVIVMPPPNVTGVLHMGHGLNNTVQDVLVRWRRMCGNVALWVPGTDHAGIATQNVVERELAKGGKTRQDVGRDAFIAEVKQFVDEKGGVILKQLRAIGTSCDWERTAYTFSPELSRAVREIFVRWYEDGLIYRGHRVIHWCPRCLTALSDEEAEHHDTQGNLYHVRYPVAGDPSRALVIATTRPETMFGDVAVAVHPEDTRYTSFVGARVVNPANGVELPVIADSYVDKAFGTGALKITPAHDANDFDVGRRHTLPMPLVMTPDARLAEFADADGRVPEGYRGMDRFDARKRVVKALEAAGALVKTEQHAHAVRRCYRCNTVVEPRLSDQWFVKMAPLAAPALQAVQDGRVRILPERWEAVYVNWMTNIRDWNISRQIWWGHRIPVFYCLANDRARGAGANASKCREHFASREDAPACPDCGGPTRQDEDVLDTWFSSQLWPFSTLGWPDGKAAPTPGDPAPFADLQAFYPTDVLVTAPEILFFWVARMLMSGMYVTQPRHRGQAFAHVPADEHPDGIPPFHSVYLTGTARDAQHRRMSKSLGNGIDPLDVVDLYGADALRWTVIAGMGIGADLLLDHENIEQSFSTGRNFATKLWNIGRFLLLQVGTQPVRDFRSLDAAELTEAELWINHRLREAIRACDAALGAPRPAAGAWTPGERAAGLRLDEYAEAARRFVWNDLADWYLEQAKVTLATAGPAREVARSALVYAFDGALRLLHPIMPFVTETLWQRLPSRRSGEWLACASWPTARGDVGDGRIFEAVRTFTSGIRELKNEERIPPTVVVDATCTGVGAVSIDSIFALTGFIERAAGARVVASHLIAANASVTKVMPNGMDVRIRRPELSAEDRTRERERHATELMQLTKQLDALRARLANEKFTAKAPPAVVEAERVKEREWTARADQLSSKLAALGGS